MAFKFTTPTKEFLTEYRNGPAFTDNPTEYSDTIRGNVGDLVRLHEVVIVEVIFNEFNAITITWDSSPAEGIFQAVGYNFVNEGFWNGATVQVIQGDEEGESTISVIDSGSGFSIMHLDKTNLDFLTDGPHTNVQIRLKDAPTRAQYKYGLVPQDTVSSSDSNYQSPLDGTDQAYLRTIIPSSPTFGDMTPLGPPNISWNLTEEIQITFNGTTGDYFHEYEIKHTFRIPYYLDGEDSNLVTLTSPEVLNGTNTYKYVSEYRFGVNSSIPGKFSQLGAEGDVGYFNENYNGKPNIFTITSQTITNASATGTLEVTETNSVALSIEAEAGSAPFVVGQQVIVGHSRLPSATEYQEQPETYISIWLLDTLKQDAGAVAVNSNQITNLVVTYVDSEHLTMTFDIAYTVSERDLIDEEDRWLLWVTLGEEALAVDLENQVNLRITDVYSKNNNIPGILYDHTIAYTNSLNAVTGPRSSTDWQGWDMDFVGCFENVKMLQVSEDEWNEITNIESQIVMVKGDEKAVIYTRTIGFTSSQLISGGYKYQIINSVLVPSLTLPSIEPLNRDEVQSVPAFPAGFQTILIETAVPRIPWQDWIANGAIPTEFFNEAELNDNLNQRTSNYSEVNSWEIYHQFLVTTKNSKNKIVIDPIKLQSKKITLVGTTEYELRSDEFIIEPIDVDPGGIWSGTVEAFDILGDPTDNIFKDVNTLIKVSFNHNLGILPAPGLGGYVSIQKKNSTEPPWQLHTNRDWTNPNNPLTPSDTLLTGNETLVEVVSSTDVVEFWFYTNKENLVEGQEYTIYGRLEKLSFQ